MTRRRSFVAGCAFLLLLGILLLACSPLDARPGLPEATATLPVMQPSPTPFPGPGAAAGAGPSAYRLAPSATRIPQLQPSPTESEQVPSATSPPPATPTPAATPVPTTLPLATPTAGSPTAVSMAGTQTPPHTPTSSRVPFTATPVGDTPPPLPSATLFPGATATPGFPPPPPPATATPRFEMPPQRPGATATATPGAVPAPPPSVPAVSGVAVLMGPPALTTHVGHVFTLTVDIANVVDLGAFTFDLLYDPAVQWVTDVQMGDFLGSTNRMVVPLGPDIDNDAGTVSFGAFTFGRSPGPVGGGRLATITCQARAAGATALTWADVQLTDTLAQALAPLVTFDGIVTVQSP